LVADPDLQRVREDAVLDVSRVILERRLGLMPGEYIGSRPEGKLLYLKMHVEDWSVETSGVLLHDVHGRVLGFHLIGRDTLHTVRLRAREIIRAALGENAASVSAWHVHPSGLAAPSKADLGHLTQLAVVLPNAGVELADYLIVSPDDAFSAASAGLLNFNTAARLHLLVIHHRTARRFARGCAAFGNCCNWCGWYSRKRERNIFAGGLDCAFGPSALRRWPF